MFPAPQRPTPSNPTRAAQSQRQEEFDGTSRSFRRRLSHDIEPSSSPKLPPEAFEQNVKSLRQEATELLKAHDVLIQEEKSLTEKHTALHPRNTRRNSRILNPLTVLEPRNFDLVVVDLIDYGQRCFTLHQRYYSYYHAVDRALQAQFGLIEFLDDESRSDEYSSGIDDLVEAVKNEREVVLQKQKDLLGVVGKLAETFVQGGRTMSEGGTVNIVDELGGNGP